MLDRAEILARRKLDVLDGHVVLEVDPLAALGAGPRPCRLDAIALVGGRRARRSAGSAASLMRLAQQPRQGEGSIGRADDADAIDRIARNERRQWFVEAQLAPGLAKQMHGRREAARDQQAIGVDALAR